jgi:dipeptide/tripeptide permease
MTASNEKTVSTPKNLSGFFNRFLYGGFVVMSIYFLVTNQLDNAMSNLGIALIFDPFDQKVTWSDRPLYQRVWLTVHVVIVLGLMVFWAIQKF